MNKSCLEIIDDYLSRCSDESLEIIDDHLREFMEAAKTEIERLRNLDDDGVKKEAVISTNDSAFELLSQVQHNGFIFFDNVICNANIAHAKLLIKFVSQLNENEIFDLLSIADDDGKTALHDLAERYSLQLPIMFELLGKLSIGE